MFQSGMSPVATAVVVAPPPSGAVATSFTLTTTAATGTYPFTLGMGFAKSAATSVTTDLLNAQVVIKRRWSDGSVKHALIAGRASLTQNVARTVNVSAGTQGAGGAALTTANILAAAPTGTVDCGAFGSVSLASLLSSPTRTWVQGSEMIEAHYEADIGTSLMAARYRVRLFADGRVFVRAWLENGYLDNGAGALSGGVDRTFAPVITLGGTVVYSPGSVTLYKGQRLMAERWVSGGDPLVIAIPENDYIVDQAKLLPHYRAGWRTPSASVLNSFTQAYTPLGRGDLTAYMADTGYQPQIGLLTQWDSLFGTSGDSRVYKSVIAHSFHLNSYAICWRDRTTKLPVKPASFPNWSINGPDQGGDRFTFAGTLAWEVNHMPSEGYLAYLITGDYDHYETMLMHCALCYLARSSSGGLGTNRNMEFETRGAAWCMRNFAQLAAIAPDGDAVAAEYRTLLGYQSSYWRSKYDVAGASQLGIPGSAGTQDQTQPLSVPMFEYFFWICTVGHSWDIEADTGADAQSLRDFLYKSIVGMLGPNGASSYCFSNLGKPITGGGATAKVNISTEVVTGDESRYPTDANWYQTWGQVFTASMGVPNTNCGNTLLGVGGGAPNISYGAWGMALASISFAVDHGAPGAQASFDRLIGATNWPALRDTTLDGGFPDRPMFAITPRSWTELPSWVPSPGQIANISLNTMAAVNPCPANNCVYSPAEQQQGIFSYSSGAYVDGVGTWGRLSHRGGGHDAYYGNETYWFDFDTRLWTRRKNPGLYGPGDDGLLNEWGEYAPGEPAASHTYRGIFGLSPALGGGTEGSLVQIFYGAAGETAHNYKASHRFDYANQTYSRYANDLAPSYSVRGPGALDKTHGKFYLTVNANGSWSPLMMILDCATRNWTQVSCPTQDQFTSEGYTGMEYCPALDCLVAIEVDMGDASPTNPKVYTVPCSNLTEGFTLRTTTAFSGELLVGMSLNWAQFLGKLAMYCSQGQNIVYYLKPPATIGGTWEWSSETFGGDTPASPPVPTGYTQSYSRFLPIDPLRCFAWYTSVYGPVQLWRPQGT